MKQYLNYLGLYRCEPPIWKFYKGKDVSCNVLSVILEADSLPCMLMSVLPVCAEEPELFFSSTLEIVISKKLPKSHKRETTVNYSVQCFFSRITFTILLSAGQRSLVGKRERKKSKPNDRKKEASSIHHHFPKEQVNGWFRVIQSKCPE